MPACICGLWSFRPIPTRMDRRKATKQAEGVEQKVKSADAAEPLITYIKTKLTAATICMRCPRLRSEIINAQFYIEESEVACN